MADQEKKKKFKIDMSIFSKPSELIDRSETNCLLPTTPAIDYRLGGGIPNGSMVYVVSPPKIGKTLLCVHICKNALAQGRYVFFFDAEARIEGQKYFNYADLDKDNDRFRVTAQSDYTKPISGNTIYSTIIHLMQDPKYFGAVYVVDSMSSVVSQNVLDDPEVTDQRRDSTAKLNADFVKKSFQLIRSSGSIVIGTQHLMTPMSMYKSSDADGGDKLKFAGDIKLMARHNPLDLDGKKINVDANETLEGLSVNWSLPFNKRLAPYISSADPIVNYFNFLNGNVWEKEVFELMKRPEFGIISPAGAWYKILGFGDDGETKIQGKDNTIKFVKDNREFFEKLLISHYTENYGANYEFRNPYIEK